MVVAVHAEAGPALVGELPGGLEEKETVFRGGAKDAAAAAFAEQVVFVAPRFESEEGETKAILPARLSVAAAAVAPVAGEQGDDFIPETDRDHLVVTLHRHLARRTAGLAPGRRDDGRPVAERTNETGLVHFNDPRGLAGETRLAGDIPLRRQQHQLVAVVGADQSDLPVLAPLQSVPGPDRANREAQAEDEADSWGSEAGWNQNNGSGLPSQMMKGRPSWS